MRSEVAIVGAGVIGSACAFELASAGVSVSVFDLRPIGQGASQASAGVLAPYIEGHESGPLRSLGRRSLDQFDGFVARVVEATGRTIQYTRNGTLEVALQPDHADRLRQSSDALRHEGIAAHWIEARELRELEPLVAAGALGGLLIDIHGFTGVPEFTEALASAAMGSGARFALDSRVVSIGRSPDQRVVVTTENGPSVVDHVILAAGCWAGQVRIDGLADPIPVRPIRGQLVHLSWQTTQPLRRVLWGTECYIVPWLNGRVLVGATVEDTGFDERATAAGVRDLLEAGCALVPPLRQASFEEVRVGLRPASPDGLPIVGRSEAVPGLIYATGHYRNGVLLTPLTAALVKSLVMGEDADSALELLRPSRLGRL